MSIEPRQKDRWTATVPLTIGIFAIVLLVGGVGYWSVNTKIAGAVIASGSVQVEANRQIVQHLEGGVVGDIVARDGDKVAAGDILLRFDGTLLKSELAVLDGQLFEIYARKVRLEAERDSVDTLRFPDDLLSNAEMADLVAGQQRLFDARKQSLETSRNQLREQIVQIESQIEGGAAQLVALERQNELIGKELADFESLLSKGLVQASRVIGLQRETARIAGEIGQLVSNTAGLRANINRINIELVRLVDTRREEAITALRDISVREVEISERRLALLERLSRLEVRAPMNGTVYGSTVFALQSVVQPAAPIMYVIPQGQPLVIQAQIETVNVDQVFVGQDAILRFSAFDQRTTPELIGKVINVSADAFTDDNTGFSFYSAKLIPVAKELDKLGDVVLVPGMPVEIYMQTGERSPLSYLTKPFTDYFNKALRED